MRNPLVSLALILVVAPAYLAQDATFKRARYSSLQQPDVDVTVTVTNSKILIKSKKANARAKTIDFDIPFSSIDALSYELASRHRIAQGESMLSASIATGVVLMATKTKMHWLTIKYGEGEAANTILLRLDKSEFRDVIATLEARTGKHIAVVDPETAPLNPTAGSKNVDEVIPFRVPDALAALKPAMESSGCKVTDFAANRIECKRTRGYSERTGSGAEKVTAKLEPNGEGTRVRIWTGKGAVGRLGKKNWSAPIYQEMLKNLQKTAQSTSASVYRSLQTKNPVQ